MSRVYGNDYTLDNYQEESQKTATYPDVGYNLIYPALKLAGESGEVADKIGKWWRNHGYTAGHQLSAEEGLQLVKEMGDVLWYIAALAKELNLPLSYIAEINIRKLQDRKQRNVIKGEGDNR